MAKDYEISKSGGTCSLCRKELAPGQEFMASVREAEDVLHRADYCLDCWPDQDSSSDSVLGTWRARVPMPQEKKKLFVDDGVLVSFFERLADADSDARITFRYVLALILMRKKLLVYDRSDRGDDEAEVWHMHFRGSDEDHSVIDPKMDGQKVADVSAQLGEILEAEL